MCLAIPGKVVEVTDVDGVRTGRVQFGGLTKQVCFEYTRDAQPGDYVLVHVGFALGKIDAEEAARTYRILQELDQLGELQQSEPEAVDEVP